MDRCTTCGGGFQTGPPAVCPACAFGYALGVDDPEEPQEPDPSSDGERVGPYRLVRPLGEGGMGTVWEAVQESPVRRRVALKRIKAGMDSAQVLARFESERQALALMSHPNIAPVLDAGQTSEGRPYFVLEYVAGPSITDYCDQERLDLRARLDLFLEVCAGIQHAHQKGVIHRDIKPSNVLVQTEKGHAIPKIIDFGIAKAVGGRLTDRSLMTRAGQPLGTLEFMSPEQAGGAAFDVDTRTDVYALGALLYVLLTGHLPFDPAGKDDDALRRLIREVDPPLPGARVAASGATGDAAARARGTDRAGLARRLRGDLDGIVAKALAKERAHRYGSPDELAADLRRHLAHEPVAAGPPGRLNRMSRFARRHTLAVTAGAVIGALLLTTSVVMTLLAGRLAAARDRARVEAATARAALQFLTDTFRVPDPDESRGAAVTAREILDRGAAGIERDLKEAPEARAEMMAAVGRSYANLGVYDRAEDILRRTLVLRRSTWGDRDARTWQSALQLAEVVRYGESAAESEALSREALAALISILGEEDPEVAEAHRTLGETLVEAGRLEEAEPQLRQAVAILEKAHEADDRGIVAARAALAECLMRRGSYDDAEALYRSALELQQRILGTDHPDTINLLNGLGLTAAGAGRTVAAAGFYREALDLSRRVLGEEHPTTWTQESNLGSFLSGLGKLDDAEPLLRSALEGRRRLLGPRSQGALATQSHLADLERERGDSRAAEELYREALAGFQETLGPDHLQTMRVRNNLGVLLRQEGRLAEAEAYYRASVDSARRVLGDGHPDTLTASGNLGEIFALQGRLAQGESLLSAALTNARETLPPGHAVMGSLLRKYGMCLTRLGRFGEAEKNLLAARDILHAALGDDNPQMRASRRELVALYTAWEKPAEAARWVDAPATK